MPSRSTILPGLTRTSYLTEELFKSQIVVLYCVFVFSVIKFLPASRVDVLHVMDRMPAFFYIYNLQIKITCRAVVVIVQLLCNKTA